MISFQPPAASRQSKILIFLISLILLVTGSRGLAANSFAQQKEGITAYFFYGRECPHCAKEEHFLDYLQEKYDFLEVKKFEIYYDVENAKLLQKIAKEINVDGSTVPLLIVGEKSISGYLNDETTGRKIENTILDYYKSANCPDVVGDIICNGERNNEKKEPSEKDTKISLPFLGEINTRKFSLPALTVVLGLADGFNPCAMWVLLFLISLLLGMKDRRRMWLLGIAFIMASGFVYYIFMAAWLNVLLFLGFISYVRVAIGLVAIGSGAYHLREYLTNKSGSCKVVKDKKRQKIFEKLRELTGDKSFLAALMGIVLLAFAVNLVELVCSAGLPAIYTQVLTLSNLAGWQYYSYILLYILFFMFDDLFVFSAAMLTLQATGISHKYTRASNLLGGIIIFTLGILLIFKPGWVMLG